MPLMYHPRVGEILVCKYPSDMKAPEMVKSRPVVVVSPRLKRRSNLVTVVPLSSTEPKFIQDYHYEINITNPFPEPWNHCPCWAICDHPMTVSFDRVDLMRIGKDKGGKRKYYQHKLDSDDVAGIKLALKAALGLLS